VSAARVAVLTVTVAACAKLANIPSYGLEDSGSQPDVPGIGGGSSCWGTPGCITAIAAGYKRTCAIADQTLYCWGNAPGTGASDVGTPQQVATGVSSVSLSGDVASPGTAGVNCFTSGSGLSCWGDDDFDQLEQQHASNNKPVLIDANNYGHVAVGADHVCAITQDGGVLCWGADGDYQLGSDLVQNMCGGASCSSAPVHVLDDAGNAIAAGLSHTCVQMTSGAVECWGLDSNGQLGNGREGRGSNDVLSTPIGSGNNVKQIATGSRHTCAITAMSTWACWGDGLYGALGNGGTGDVSTPTLSGTHLFDAIAAGARNTCGVDDASSVECWGDNTTGVVGSAELGMTIESPVSITVDQAQLLAVGYSHACAVLIGGQLECWGDNSAGELGDGSTQHQTCGTTALDCSPTPVVVSAPQ
jgi:alpha-tubulin suppressor-like RCC1 family protein